MLYDKDIRDPLFDFLDEIFGKNRIIEEKQIGKSRADVMMILPESIWGIEIKSDADTYARLERQIKDYNRFFDYNMVVVGASHGKSIADHVPEYWGIITVEEIQEATVENSLESRDILLEKVDSLGDGIATAASKNLDFYMLRQPQRNPKREKKVLFRNQLSFLWKMELMHIQEINGMKKLVSFSKKKRVLRIMETVPEEELKKQLCEALIERDYSCFDDNDG